MHVMKSADYKLIKKEINLDAAASILDTYRLMYNSPQSRLAAIKTGLSSQALSDLKELTGETVADNAYMLNIPVFAISKLIVSGIKLNKTLSQHLLCLFDLYEKGIETAGNLHEFNHWTHQYNIDLDAKPIDLLDTVTGISIVRNELLKIDRGNLA